MSSNAFARSRPRLRHQRVPKTNSSCDHPRFIQLVNELARIKEAKKKLEEIETLSGASVSDCGLDSNASANNSAPCSAQGPLNRSTSCGTAPVIVIANSGPQTSNGYRSLDGNQSTSALHDNYHQHHHQQPQQNHYLPHDPQHLSNNLHPDDQCPCKGPSTNFGYSKQNLVVEQNSSDFTTSNNNSDLRQDENRSKRKRSANDLLVNYRKNSSSSLCNQSGASKRLKSSPDAIRPLSPSFTKCPICLLDTMDRDPSFTNTCFHLFCYVCIENWAKSKATCPLCRTKFTKIIYNIKSATTYEEKSASPIRRDDEDGYSADRIMLEQLSGLHTVSSRNSEEVQFLFENLRNPEVLMPQYFVNQMDPRQGESLQSFNAMTTTSAANFNSNVPHPGFATASYSPIASNYINLFPSRIAPSTSTAAITGAYTANNSLTNINNDPSSRRISRRYVYTRNYDQPTVEVPSRVSRASNIGSNINNPPGVPIERHHHHQHQQQHQHQHPHQHANQHHQHGAHRSTIDNISSRQNQRLEPSHTHLQLPYLTRHYNPNPYPRRPYNNPQVEQHHLLDTLYRPMPDM